MRPENKQKTGRTVPRTAFKPGQSGNPGGRKPKTEPERIAEELFRKKTPEAANALWDMAEDLKIPAKVRVDIYKYILDRTLGKPRISGEVELYGEVNHNVNIFDPEERARILASIEEDERRSDSGKEG
jgi:hypothetical protein